MPQEGVRSDYQVGSNSDEMATDADRAMMQRCLELARCALGRTAPNPLVGSVIPKWGNCR